jgi:intracellular sulfur oxidation DsrE/DsrF family protein
VIVLSEILKIFLKIFTTNTESLKRHHFVICDIQHLSRGAQETQISVVINGKDQ